jgi:uncharacterized membrane protein YcjF (UPF0283 family)
MYGLAAIEQANGWAMAGAGACIVLTGLSVLSFLISMIPRLTSLFEEKKQSQEIVKETAAKPAEKKTIERFPDDVKEASEIFIEETKDLGEEFTLIDLHKKSKEIGVVDPHLTIRRFRDAGILVSTGEERFSWQPISE